VVQLPGTLSAADVYADRARVCDLGYLRQPCARADGTLGYRCAAEPEADFARKDGDSAATTGRKCLCNGLMSAAGLAQVRPDGTCEPSILTAGSDLEQVALLLPAHAESYTAADVISYVLGNPSASVGVET